MKKEKSKSTNKTLKNIYMYVCSLNSHAPISKVSKYAYYPQVNIKLQILV